MQAVKKLGLVVCCLVLAIVVQAQKVSDKQAVLKVMHDQEEAWNRYDLEGFMQGYWQNDSLRFVSKRGITYGWNEVLANYRKAYPDMTRTGHLQFTISHIDALGKNAIMVTGAWKVEAETGMSQGFFTLVFRKINGRWVIVSDHTS